MHFTHRADPTRSATVEPAAGPALVFRYTDARGKPQEDLQGQQQAEG